METEQNIKNNNQSKIQNSSSNFQTNHVVPENGVYICMPSVHSVRPFQHYHKYKKEKNVIKNYDRLKSLSDYRENRVCYKHSYEEPMDLTCTEKREEYSTSAVENDLPLHSNGKLKFELKNMMQISSSKIYTDQQNFIDNHPLKRRGRKRKYIINNSHMIQEFPLPSLETTDILSDPDLCQNADNRETEVLKAAKSLFSKRTRTLFHWMYPNAPKTQLKAAVATSWETLGEQEKEFYISQVLGRFGFSQTNLMVNPQLGGILGILSLPPLDLSTSNFEGAEETSTAVSSLLLSEHGSSSIASWMQAGTTSRPVYTQRINRKRGRLGRPPGSRNRKQIKEEFPVTTDDPVPDEFQDDPELSREFQQFKWTLHFNDNIK